MSSPPNPPEAPRRYGWTLRRILWFAKGEVREISFKLAALKYFDESSVCELNVLLTLALSVPFAFFAIGWWGYSMWWGLASVWGFKYNRFNRSMRRDFLTLCLDASTAICSFEPTQPTLVSGDTLDRVRLSRPRAR
jgi:hypothetical protein